MNSFNLWLLFSDVTCITCWEQKRLSGFPSWLSQILTPFFTFGFVLRSYACGSPCSSFWVYLKLWLFAPSGQRCGFPRRWECNCWVNRLRGRCLMKTPCKSSGIIYHIPRSSPADRKLMALVPVLPDQGNKDCLSLLPALDQQALLTGMMN